VVAPAAVVTRLENVNERTLFSLVDRSIMYESFSSSVFVA